MQEVTGIKKILYHIKAWFRSLGLPMYNIRLWRVEGEKKEYIGSQFFFRYKAAKFWKDSWDDDKEITATIIREIVFLF